MKFDSWLAHGIFLGLLLAGACLAAFNPVGLPLAAIGALGFGAIYIFNLIYTDMYDGWARELDDTSRQCTSLQGEIKAEQIWRKSDIAELKAESDKTILALTDRLHAVEAKFTSMQSTITFMKGK